MLVRHNDAEFMQAGFGIYYDTFANLSREPPDGREDQFTGEWQEHTLEFEIKTEFKDETTLRFSLPRNVKGTFDLTDTRLKVAK